MPIAAFLDYSDGHWRAVETILREALRDVGFDAKLVSQESASGVIHQRIITNLYANEIVVCDVSARNPNVMFELGMRLAFDKPTVIVKDEDTPFSFDISAIEHVPYTRSLSYLEIQDFKKRLGEKVKSTYQAKKTDPNYSTFLKHIGGITPARLDVKEIPLQDYISERFDSISAQIADMRRGISSSKRPDFLRTDQVFMELSDTAFDIGLRIVQEIDNSTPMNAALVASVSSDNFQVLRISGADNTRMLSILREVALSAGIKEENIRIRRR